MFFMVDELGFWAMAGSSGTTINQTTSRMMHKIQLLSLRL